MTKIRNWSIVIQNVSNEKSQNVEDFLKSFNYKNYVFGIEPNPEKNGEGFHLHIFLFQKSPTDFKPTLKKLVNFSKTIVTPKPEGEERDWGRVQLDQCRGTFAECVRYLKNPKKDKEISDDVREDSPIIYGRGNVTCRYCKIKYDSVLPAIFTTCYKCQFKKDIHTCENDLQIQQLTNRYVRTMEIWLRTLPDNPT